MADATTKTTAKTSAYKVLTNLMHNGGGRTGKLYRKGDTVQLTEATAAPLLKSGAIEPIK
jgi:hypothetical protein